jgi:hypothetical protein
VLSGCDGLLLVPCDDQKNVEIDIAYIGHHLRKSACARGSKTLPCAIIDGGVALRSKNKLQHSARNLRIDWINASATDWTHSVGELLARANGA